MVIILITTGDDELKTFHVIIESENYNSMNFIREYLKQKLRDSTLRIIRIEEGDDSMEKNEIIMLIGSARFRDTFLRIEKIFTFQGYLVLIPFWDGIEHKNSYSSPEWEFLMKSAFKKINMAHKILVIDKDGYIGEHTKQEIKYARKLGKIINYYSKMEG